MKVFHGSTSIVDKPLANIGRNLLDFGKGFYLTTLEAQAISWASRPLNQGKQKYLNIYELDFSAVVNEGYKYLHFNEYNAEWLNFVISNRKGGSDWRQFDIVEGGIANDRIFNTIELYSSGLISENEALQRLIYEKPNNQICVLNQNIIDNHLTFVEAREIKEEAQ